MRDKNFEILLDKHKGVHGKLFLGRAKANGTLNAEFVQNVKVEE